MLNKPRATDATKIFLQHLLQYRNIASARIDGSVLSSDARQRTVDRFNSSEPGGPVVLLLSIRAGGVGLNLVGGNIFVLMEPDW